MDGIAINNRKYNAMTLLSATTVDETISPGVFNLELKAAKFTPHQCNFQSSLPLFLINKVLNDLI